YQNFFSREPSSSTCRCLVSVYSRSPSIPNSLPIPLCLYPPNGAFSEIRCHSLIQTVPALSRRATAIAFSLSRDQTPPPRPYIVSFAMAIASSTVLYLITESTGPKISSWAIFIEFPTPEKIVGSTKNPLLSSGASGTLPPVTTAAPSLSPLATYPMTRSRCCSEISGPISVFGSFGSPSLIFLVFSATLPRNPSWIFSGRNNRVPASQHWP